MPCCKCRGTAEVPEQSQHIQEWVKQVKPYSSLGLERPKPSFCAFGWESPTCGLVSVMPSPLAAFG